MSENPLLRKIFKWAHIQNIKDTWPLEVAKLYETLGLHRLNDINLVVEFSEIVQELNNIFLTSVKLSGMPP